MRSWEAQLTRHPQCLPLQLTPTGPSLTAPPCHSTINSLPLRPQLINPTSIPHRVPLLTGDLITPPRAHLILITIPLRRAAISHKFTSVSLMPMSSLSAHKKYFIFRRMRIKQFLSTFAINSSKMLMAIYFSSPRRQLIRCLL